MKEKKKPYVRIYDHIEEPGATISEQLDILKQICPGSNLDEMFLYLRWHKFTCPKCGNKDVWRSGSTQHYCYLCQAKYETQHNKLYMRKYRKRAP